MREARPQWLTVHTAAGEDIKMRLPASPSIQDVRSVLNQVGRLADQHAQHMDATAHAHRGWSLTTRRHDVVRDN